MVPCDHCLLEIPEEKAIVEEIRGQKQFFCCNGCRGVYRLIRDEGLDEFYERRGLSWTPGPPGEISLEHSVFAEAVRDVEGEGEIDIILDGIRCASCIWLIEKILLRTDGVIYARVNYATHKARIRWNPDKTEITKILGRITTLGYTPKPYLAKAHEEQLRKEQRDLLIRFGTAAFFTMQLMLYSVAMYAGYFQGIGIKTKTVFQVIALLLTTPVLFYSGMPFLRGSIRGLRNFSFTMDFLIATGAGSAYLYSIYQIFTGGEVYFDTTAMIITLILLGRYIESGAKKRSSEVITRLLSLSPKEARIVMQDSGTREHVKTITVSSIKKGDCVQIQPGERIPVDGIVVRGRSEVDESMLTGESLPVPKKAGSEVFCGTQNLNGSFVFEVRRTGVDTVLSQIIRTVEDAQARRAPVQVLADRVVGFFVPSVLILSIITGVAWFVANRMMTVAVMNAISVLVIACPCALGLATPLAVLIGTTRGASRGILMKGGDIIERASNIGVIILDKTGTVTEGRPVLKAWKGVGITDKEALRLAASVERFSEHTIAKAIINTEARGEYLTVSGFTAYPGSGVKGETGGRKILIGNREFIDTKGMRKNLDSAIDSELSSWIRAQAVSGTTVLYMSSDEKLAGIFLIADKAREEAGAAVRNLTEMDYDVMMVTGDEQGTALSIAGDIRLPEEAVLAQRLPNEKAEAIQEIQRKGIPVMMVGDGINDAPALVQSDVGVAMGRATDIALESSDMVLMRSDLGLIAEAITLSKKIYRTIQQNLFWAFIYNMVALPLAVLGLLHPIIAAGAMTLSSLSVVGNSVRLKRA
ncbi:heavy metal translocating P-type ATPase [bacterium]|nr:MAG: heavy metal translocating P-type ATPase [bacterium]